MVDLGGVEVEVSQEATEAMGATGATGAMGAVEEDNRELETGSVRTRKFRIYLFMRDLDRNILYYKISFKKY